MKKILIVDSSHLFFRVLFTNLDAVKEDPNFIIHVYLITLLKQIRKHEPSEVILALDSNHSWRKDYYEENIKTLGLNESDPFWKKFIDQGYKGQRKKDPTVNFGELFKLMDELYDVLNKNTNFKCIRIQGSEGDDVISTLTKYLHNENEIIILSSDKDFIQLLKYENVFIYDPLKLDFVNGKNININEYKKLHILTGDKSDNIPPVKIRMGDKTARNLLPILDKTLQLDINVRKIYNFNEKLIDLDFTPEEIKKDIIKFYNSCNSTYNFDGLLSFCISHNLRDVSEQLPYFKVKENNKEIKQTKTNSESVENIMEKQINNLFS